jgi:hypothetical protein
MGAIFRKPLELEAGVAAALAKQLDTEAAIRERIVDMRANGLLLEITEQNL